MTHVVETLPRCLNKLRVQWINVIST